MNPFYFALPLSLPLSAKLDFAIDFIWTTALLALSIIPGAGILIAQMFCLFFPALSKLKVKKRWHERRNGGSLHLLQQFVE
jgi:hypothetical protein